MSMIGPAKTAGFPAANHTQAGFLKRVTPISPPPIEAGAFAFNFQAVWPYGASPMLWSTFEGQREVIHRRQSAVAARR
jgi:hypothetical protein